MSRKKKDEASETNEAHRAEPEARYSGDYPIENPSEDRFNRWPFAKRIADTLRDRQDPSCIVLGIYGAWGEGKTSVLNLIEAELKKSEKVAVVRFNPWYFSSEEVLIKGLFDTLAEGVGRKLANRREQLGDALGKLGTFLSVASLSVAGGAVSVNPGEAVSKMGSALSQAELADYRKRVQEILRQEGMRVVVLIDDIDRLERQEIQALFKTVRLSADFESVSYVLAFDREVVAASLGERYGGGEAAHGAAFLGKILQVPLHLPTAKKEVLRDIAFQGMDAALKLAEIQISANMGETIAHHFTQGLESSISTPRQGHLISNALLFAVPLLKGEVNVADQILIESLRILHPQIYDAIRSHPDLFLRFSTLLADKSAPERTKALLDGAMVSLTPKQRADLEDLLEHLFPRIKKANYDGSWNAIWDRKQCICSAKYFERYFSYAVDKSDVSDVELESFLATLERSSQSQACKLWADFASSERAGAIIDKLRLREKELSGSLADNLMAAMAKAGEDLPRVESLLSFSPFRQAAILIIQLIVNLFALEDRAVHAGKVVSLAPPLFAVEILRWLYPGENPENKVLLDEDLEKIGAKLSRRLEDECRSEWVFLKYGKDAIGLLWMWQRYGSDEAVKKYVADSLRADIGRLDEFLKSFAGRGHSPEAIVRFLFERHSYDNMAGIVDPEIVYELVMEAYGDSIRPDGNRLGNETPDRLLIANQFAYVHRRVMEEKTASNSEESGGKARKKIAKAG